MKLWQPFGSILSARIDVFRLAASASAGEFRRCTYLAISADRIGGRRAGRVRPKRSAIDWRPSREAEQRSLIRSDLFTPRSAIATLHSLDRAYDERDAYLAFLAVDPDFDSLRSDLKFAALVRRVNLIR